MEALEEEQQGEEGHEAGAEVVAEDGEGQAGLGDGVPGALHQVLGSPKPRQPPAPHSSIHRPSEVKRTPKMQNVAPGRRDLALGSWEKLSRSSILT